jgi:hypothetical protein
MRRPALIPHPDCGHQLTEMAGSGPLPHLQRGQNAPLAAEGRACSVGCVPNRAHAFVGDLGRATPSICSSLSFRQGTHCIGRDGTKGRHSPMTRRRVRGYDVRALILRRRRVKVKLGWERCYSRYFLRISSKVAPSGSHRSAATNLKSRCSRSRSSRTWAISRRTCGVSPIS